MDSRGRPEPIANVEDRAEEDDGAEEEEGCGELGFASEKDGGIKEKKSGRKGQAAAAGGGGGVAPPRCQAEKCSADLTTAKRYHRRHKVCELHAKSAAVVVAGVRQRFCQQCSRFHELSEFDDTKRSCRRRLAGHNERRRKSSSDPQGEGSSRRRMGSLRLNDSHCRQPDERDRGLMAFSGNSTYKEYHIR
ncbi:hypothetical protein NMG60_11003404 [Bertholletia excelsa]